MLVKNSDTSNLSSAQKHWEKITKGEPWLDGEIPFWYRVRIAARVGYQPILCVVVAACILVVYLFCLLVLLPVDLLGNLVRRSTSTRELFKDWVTGAPDLFRLIPEVWYEISQSLRPFRRYQIGRQCWLHRRQESTARQERLWNVANGD